MSETTDPSWFEGILGTDADGWSLACRFDSPPRFQGNRSIVRVRFMMETAPHDRLAPVRGSTSLREQPAGTLWSRYWIRARQQRHLTSAYSWRTLQV